MEDIDLTYADAHLGDFGKNIEISYYLKGVLEFKLIAPEMNQFLEISTFPKGIDIYVYNQKLDTIATIEADYALQDKNQHIVEAKSNVVLTNLNQEQLNTEQLFWNSETKKIYTDDFVTLNTENQIIMGFGFEADQYFSTYTLSNITGTIYL
tara:strand:- start:3421 stop:3876 length:456 start_codon:yes stop_codon:yes gene_type:complete